MGYRFSIRDVVRRKEDGVATGLVITVCCGKREGDNATAVSELTWFAPKAAFPIWPPTSEQQRIYVENYLQMKLIDGSGTRASLLRQRAVVVEDDPIEDIVGETLNIVDVVGGEAL